MILDSEDRKLISSIFFLNVPPTLTDLYPTIFSWDLPQKGQNWAKFYYILDKRGRLKWIFPEATRYPVFLSIENELHTLPPIKKRTIRLSFFLGLKQWIVSGSFYVNEDYIFPLYDLINSVPHESFAILTNTTKNFRKSVIALNQGKYISHFIKLAHTNEATELIYNEVYGLQILSQRRLRKLVHPFLSHTEGDHAIIISSVKPAKNGYRSMHLESIHFKALGEMYKVFHHVREMQDISLYTGLENVLTDIREIIEDDSTSIPDNTKQDFLHILTQYQILFHSVSPHTELKVSLTHGQFVPSNMYLTSRQLCLYDWENMNESLPLLFDIFYFTYYTFTSQTKAITPESVWEFIIKLLKRKELVDISIRYQIDPWYYHKLFLILEIPYLLKQVLKDMEESDTLLLPTPWIAFLLHQINAPELQE